MAWIKTKQKFLMNAKSIILTTQQSCCAVQLDRILSQCKARETTGWWQYKIALIIEYFTPTLSLFWIMPSEQTKTFPWSWKLMFRTSVCRFRQNCLCAFHVRSQSQPDANQEKCSVMQNGCDGVAWDVGARLSYSKQMDREQLQHR